MVCPLRVFLILFSTVFALFTLFTLTSDTSENENKEDDDNLDNNTIDNNSIPNPTRSWLQSSIDFCNGVYLYRKLNNLYKYYNTSKTISQGGKCPVSGKYGLTCPMGFVAKKKEERKERSSNVNEIINENEIMNKVN